MIKRPKYALDDNAWEKTCEELGIEYDSNSTSEDDRENLILRCMVVYPISLVLLLLCVFGPLGEYQQNIERKEISIISTNQCIYDCGEFKSILKKPMSGPGWECFCKNDYGILVNAVERK